MRLISIWTLPASTFRERLRRTRDWAAQKIAHRLPKRVRYWTTIQEVARATMTSRNVPATPLTEVLDKLDRPKVIT